MACPCCVFCNAHVSWLLVTFCHFHIHLCIPESCGFSHIGLDYDLFPHSFYNNVGWMEWISCLVLSCLVCLSMLSFLLLMWMFLEWEMWDGWVCDFLCAGCLSVWKKDSKFTLCFITILPYQSIFLYSQSSHVVYEAMYFVLNTNKWMQAGVWWIGHFLCTHVFLPPPDPSTGQ